MELPLEYRWLRVHNFDGFTPWYLIDPFDSEEIRKEYHLETGKDILPFARRQDKDDIAGFELLDNKVLSKVLTVHLTWKGKLESPGFPKTKESNDIFDWLNKVVIPDTKDWISEADLKDLMEE